VERILLVEDDPGAQLLYRNRLHELGYEVVVAATGARGLLEARASRFDLFLVDIGLGSGIDGYEVCRRLKGIPQIHAVPVVLISGRVQTQEDLHIGYEAGCEAFLVKGDLTLLEDVVRAMLRIKSLQDDLALQNRLLEEQNRHLQAERERGADLERALRESGSRVPVVRDIAAGLPDGVLLVGGEGIVRASDRGAQDILGKEIEGKHLATIAPGSTLEAFVRNARTDRHEAFRFDLGDRSKGTVRSFSASVLPTVSRVHGMESDRVVLLSDATKRRVAAELLRSEESSVPRRELGALLEAARRTFHPSALLGESAAMVDLRGRLVQALSGNQPVLLCGPVGSGKGLIARILHFSGSASGPFVPVNVSALAPGLIETELFGCTRQTAPEAIADRPGLVQQAHCGTLFLDEIGETALAIQEKLLELLEEKQVTRVGSSQPERVEVRLLAAATVDLEELVAQGRFLRDLLDRLRATEIPVPPLARREDDVLVLAEAFLARHGAAKRLRLSAEVLSVLSHHDWPGNVAELERCVEDACSAAAGPEIRLEHLPANLQELEKRMARDAIPATGPRRDRTRASQPRTASEAPLDLGVLQGVPSLELYEKQAIVHALHCTRGDNLAAAKLLKIGKSTFYRKLKAHGLNTS